MAETLIQEVQKADDVLIGTAEEFSKRMESEPGFFKTYQEKYEAGKIKVVDKNEPVVEAPVAVPAAEPAKEPVKAEAPEEEITVKIKKSDLGKYENINEFLKSSQEKEKFIDHLKSQVSELSSQINEVGQSKAEVERLKAEKVELEKKISSAVAVPVNAPVSVAQASALVDIKLPTFDNLNGLTDEQLQEKLYEAETLKKVIDGVRQTSKIIDYSKTLEDKIGKLEAKINATAEAQSKMTTSYEEMTKQTQEKARVDGIFNNVGELQNKFDELKTKIPLRELDLQYTKFARDVGLVEKKYDEESVGALMDKFFNDPSVEGDALRQKVEALGIKPPEDVDKYLTIRRVLSKAEESKLALDKAYVLHQYESGGINKVLTTANTEEAKRREAALETRQQFAKVADGTPSEVTPVPIEAEEKQFAELLAKNTPFSEVKKNPEMKRLYDKFYGQSGIPIDWNKY